MLLTLAASMELQVRHYDVKTVFLSGDIHEEPYKATRRFLRPGEQVKVCEIQKALYGTKAISRKLESQNRFCSKGKWSHSRLS
jgi:Reverse transcriptase (RNA-dependent DNA polymerase)